MLIKKLLLIICFLLMNIFFVSCQPKKKIQKIEGILKKPDILETDNPSFKPKTGEFVSDKYTVALWHFNEGKDKFVFDASGNENAGVLARAKWHKGLFSKCIDVTGKSDGLEILEDKLRLSPVHAITVEGWFYFQSVQTAPYPSLVMKPITTEGNYRPTYVLWVVNHQHDRYPAYTLNWGVTIDSDKLYSVDSHTHWKKLVGAWHYLVGTYNGKEIKIYIDGVLKGEKKVSGILRSKNDRLYIGRITHQDFHGLIDEIRISKVARSEKAVKAYWDQAKRFIGQ